MKNVILALALLVSTPAFAAPSLLETLKPHAGMYQLVQNNSANPCHSSFNFELGSETRLNVYLQEEENDYLVKGDTIVDLQQWYDTLNKWGHRFDRAPFAFINKGTQRNVIPQMGAVISHQTKFDAAKQELSHSATISTLNGRGESVQTIKFMGNDSFLYTYVLNERNVIGQLVKSTPAGECEFSRKQ